MEKVKNRQYKVLGKKGRLYLSREVQECAGIREGSILRVRAEPGKVLLEAVTMVELGDHSPEAVESYVRAAIGGMNEEKKLSMARALLKE